MARAVVIGIISVMLSLVYTALEAQPSDSLMVHLEFEGDAIDSSGNSYDGTVSGELTFVPGMVGMAASFSGGQSIFFENFPDSKFSTGDFSLTYWFNTPIDRAAAYVAKQNGCNVARSFDNRQLLSGELLFRISNGQENFDVTTTRTAGWHHFVGVRDDESLLLYLDGVLRDQLAIPAGMDIQVQSDFGISRSPCIGTGDAVSLIGEMDDFRVYERALTSEEIAAAFNVLFADSFEDGMLSSECPCWGEIDLTSVTAANHDDTFSCDTASSFPLSAQIQNTDFVFPVVEGGFSAADDGANTSCNTRDFGPHNLPITTDEASECIAQIAARCAAIGHPITNPD